MELFGSLKLYVKHHMLTAAFVLGFIVDNLTLNRVDQLFDNAVLFSYVILAMLSILLLYAGIAGRFSDRVNHFFKTKSPILMQYSFGGLLSGMLIFYGRSGSILESWPFMLSIILVIFGNETIKDRAGRLIYNLVIFFIGLFAYSVLIIPVLIGKMGSIIFVGSGLLALIVFYALVRALEHIVPNFIELQKRNLLFIIGLIFVGLNFLYFANLIPPIPLSLKHVGIYHNVVRYEDGRYELTYEKPRWWQLYRESDATFRYKPNDNIFCYASVFAPSRLTTDIYHRWEYLDESSGEWIEYGRYSYKIQGGRGEGYRGYTQIANFTEGTWRCTVETDRGQVIGRESFVIEKGEQRELVKRID